jgi:two-component system chemotaxis response regulator CheB
MKDSMMWLTRGPRENGFRPAVDPLFRTAARVAGPRVIGVIVSGGLDDGTQGLTYIKRNGGIAVVQDPQDAVMPSMPQSAIDNVEVDHVVSIATMSDLLERLTRQPIPESLLNMKRQPETTDVAEAGDLAMERGGLPGPPSPFVCPECGGALWELHDGHLLRYRCHIGHSYTAEGLMQNQTTKLEEAMWKALRALEENGGLHRRMAGRAREGKLDAMALMHDQRADEAEQRAAVIRDVLVNGSERAKEQKQFAGVVSRPTVERSSDLQSVNNAPARGKARRGSRRARQKLPGK